ncbi:conserved hypothetical protein [Talaromyces stipitatus ATCC 10500]|uniref:Alpha-glucuronidase n=1 Tax=Talaromyces stipitatus (strain ATCC 10500 / CBS 375.48 / QM 6759 / NRRL 1006) TaxID=441959 RepID=B8LVS8_TALSN|nr:uncharacterized protein TSTA_075810 [Talaromyces stipitatus ATCC 10500]EED24208.1 conserved hypothetical protein [Talaromyces stipitatus ATCC 10500]
MHAFLYIIPTCLISPAIAENGLDGWLRYALLPASLTSHFLTGFPSNIITLNSSINSLVYTAARELQKGLRGIRHKDVDIICSNKSQSQFASIVIGTVDIFTKTFGIGNSWDDLIQDGFSLNISENSVRIIGRNERGTFNPHAPIRCVNQWDNLDGSIERGYEGSSIFFENGVIVRDLTRAAEYARLLASIGVNAVVVNNVNANSSLLTPENIQGLSRIADVFRPLCFAAGGWGLSIYDPLDPGVIKFWWNITNQLYEAVPDMVGYLVKADSEGQAGPLVYNRTLAQGANLFANSLKPHGGVLMFRSFVYNKLNESDWKADRANAAVEFFKDLNGEFDENVIVQIKYGPIDFQVCEPVSPLFANLPHTNTALELQITSGIPRSAMSFGLYASIMEDDS